MRAELSPLFAPRGVVIVGASRVPGKLGTAMSEALEADSVSVALVNRTGGAGMVTSIADAAASLAGRGAVADFVVSCVPAAATADVISDAGSAGITAALVCAGGFAEIGESGIANEANLVAAAPKSGCAFSARTGPGTSFPTLGSGQALSPAWIKISPLRLTTHGLIALDAVVITVEEDAHDQTN